MSDSVDPSAHWEAVYGRRSEKELGWYRPHLETSLRLIQTGMSGIDSATILDVGGGASTLVDDLLDLGLRPTVLDISSKALAVARTRLGEKATSVTWIQGDLRRVPLPRAGFDIWHDRAVLHFLTDPADQATYVRRLRESLRRGGHAVIGVFSHEAPPRCSALDLRRYDIGELKDLLGEDFLLVEEAADPHVTPSGLAQPYTYGLFRYGSAS